MKPPSPVGCAFGLTIAAKGLGAGSRPAIGGFSRRMPTYMWVRATGDGVGATQRAEWGRHSARSDEDGSCSQRERERRHEPTGRVRAHPGRADRRHEVRRDPAGRRGRIVAANDWASALLLRGDGLSDQGSFLHARALGAVREERSRRNALGTVTAVAPPSSFVSLRRQALAWLARRSARRSVARSGPAGRPPICKAESD